MVIGSLGAIMQKDIKRLMAYSTINHIGFILMGLIPGSEDGITTISIYLILYVTMNLGVFLFYFKYAKRSNKCKCNQRFIRPL